jgi:hypothetical protein
VQNVKLGLVLLGKVQRMLERLYRGLRKVSRKQDAFDMKHAFLHVTRP